MKFSIKSMMVLAIASLTLSGCKDKTLKTFTANVPEYTSLEEWRNTTFELTTPRELTRPGKIYVKDSYLFVNEYLHGVHIFDNSNPSNPVNIGFLEVLANAEMAIKNNILYLDSYYDLLSFDISNPASPQLVDRDEDVFVFDKYHEFSSYNLQYPMTDINPEKGVITGWTVEEVTTEVNSGGYFCGTPNINFSMDAGIAESSSSFSSGPGIGGSTARFTIYNDYLYTLGDWNLKTYDISKTENPEYVSEIFTQRANETLFPAENHLFIGTTTGMLIYSLASPSTPEFVSNYDHINSCDPVVVQGSTAYVTLSTGRTCWGNVNQLDVIDISNLSSPSLISSFEMTNPKGLGVDNNLLFLCDGNDGLKVFDKTDPLTIDQNTIAEFPFINTNDVIPNDGTLIMTGNDGIYQYDYSDPSNVTQISIIPINQ